jgi:hypothetical protein
MEHDTLAKAVAAAVTPKGQRWTDFLCFYFLANWTHQAVTDRGERKDRVKATGGASCTFTASS